MTSQGSPYSRFRRALKTGNLSIVTAAAAELPQLGLSDALDVLVVIADQDAQRYPRAARRFLHRLAAERDGITLEEMRVAVAACEVLPQLPAAAGVLRELVATC